MAPETGVRTVHRRKLEKVLAEEGRQAHDTLLAQLNQEWTSISEPWEAAAHIALDDVIEPGQTRSVLLKALEYAWGDRGRVAK
jgi:acetyl-CoA carboxylase carboxyltransferase component